MLDLAQGVRAQIIKETAPKVATARIFTMPRLRHAALWGASAAAALFIAVLSSRSEVGTQRLAAALHSGRTDPALRSFDAQAETARLSDAVRGLTADGEQIKSRLAVVEHDMDDVTGSIGKELEAATAARRFDDGPTITNTATVTASLMPAAVPPPMFVASSPAMAQSPADAAKAAKSGYGVDIGSGLTILALRERWQTLRSAHPQLFAGLEPIVSVKDMARANRVELRLVVGPFTEAAAAERLCASLTPVGLFCQPTIYDGQHLALR